MRGGPQCGGGLICQFVEIFGRGINKNTPILNELKKYFRGIFMGGYPTNKKYFYWGAV